jgi:hypothetical protein
LVSFRAWDCHAKSGSFLKKRTKKLFLLGVVAVAGSNAAGAQVFTVFLKKQRLLRRLGG